MPPAPPIALLLVANLALQLFDGAATYVGWEQYGEWNPLLRAGFERWGALPTLLVAKTGAVALLLVLATTPRPRLAALALGLTFTAYTSLSFIPWTLRLLA